MIVLHPRIAPPDRLRVWLGAVGCELPKGLSWKLDNRPTIPIELAPLTGARKNTWVDPAERRAFTGVYEFTGLQPASHHRILVTTADGCTAKLSARTLPAEVPSDSAESFRVLLVSCFDRGTDSTGRAGRMVADLPIQMRPHLTLLLGDQVYLDLPTLKDFKDDIKWLAREFEGKYISNWFGCREVSGAPCAYAQVLHAAPNVSIPDDHEYWNNYPHASPIVGNTWSKRGRRRWCIAARRLYNAFQGAYPAGLGGSWHLDVKPLSFFFADSRTYRDRDRRFALADADHSRLERWVDWLQQHPDRVGVFVTGQSLLSRECGSIVGGLTDFELSDHDDYRRLSRTLLRAPGNLLFLTGDLHWGRVTSYRRPDGRFRIIEVVSSPASLVATVVQDQVGIVKNFIAGLFGSRDPWPRHRHPEEPPARWPLGTGGTSMQAETLHRQRGNHVTLLAFQRNGARIRVRVTCMPLHRESRYRHLESSSFVFQTEPRVGDLP